MRPIEPPPVPTRSAPPARTVQLRHDLPDGTHHVDWLLATAAAAAAPLIAFRLPARIDRLPAGDVIAAERIADHRAVYLDYEGPLGDAPGARDPRDRGRVSRLVQGEIIAWQRGETVWRLEIAWRETPGGERRQGVEIIRGAGSRWSIRVLF